MNLPTTLSGVTGDSNHHGSENTACRPPVKASLSVPFGQRALWKQIDAAECYLVSGSFDQAVLTALSIADQIRVAASGNVCNDGELMEMFELAGMVLVQALKELRRTPEMFIQLKTMYGSLASIPVKVFLTGATMQMTEGSGSDLGQIFEEYLAKWSYTDERVYILSGGQDGSSKDHIVTSVMTVEQYLEVAELYTVTFLSLASGKTENAILWAEKANLIEQDRQDVLNKLYALQSAANNFTAKGLQQSSERNRSALINGSTPTPEEAPKSTEPAYCGKVQGLEKGLPRFIQPTLGRVTNQFDPFFWWFHSVRIKFGQIHIVLPSGKLILLFSLLFSTVYILRRKGTRLKRALYQQASSLRRAFFDALQFAFSVQMNPLAAVQQVPQAPRGSW